MSFIKELYVIELHFYRHINVVPSQSRQDSDYSFVCKWKNYFIIKFFSEFSVIVKFLTF